MYIKGKLQTAQGRILDFEFSTNLNDKVGGWNNSYYGDFRVFIKSHLTIDNKKLDKFDKETDNLVNTVRFDEYMFKNSKIVNISRIVLDYFDIDNFSYMVGQMVEFNDEMVDWFLEKYHYDYLSPDTIGSDLNWYIEEYIYTSDNFKGLIKDIYDLSNGYMCNQWNCIIEGGFNFLYNEFEEDTKEGLAS